MTTTTLWNSNLPEQEIRDQLDSKNLDPKYHTYIGLKGASLLHLAACFSGNLDYVEYLLSLKLNPNSLDNNGDTPLHYSVDKVSQCPVAITDCLIKNGADVNIKNTLEGYTPLHRSAGWNKEIKVTQLLVEAGANLDVQDNHGNTPLHVIGMETCSLEIETYLLEKGANPDIKNDDGELYLKNIRW